MRRAVHRWKLPGGLATTIPNMADIGYPIVEAEPDGTFVITKHAGTGGRVTVASIKEQLLYEMGDPREYITPDCVADFTSIQLEQAGPDRVRFTGIRGRPATEYVQSFHQLLGRLQGHRNSDVLMARCLRESPSRRRDTARDDWNGWAYDSMRFERNLAARTRATEPLAG